MVHRASLIPCGIVLSNSGTPMAATRPRQPPRNEAATISLPIVSGPPEVLEPVWRQGHAVRWAVEDFDARHFDISFGAEVPSADSDLSAWRKCCSLALADDCYASLGGAGVVSTS